MKNFRFLLLAGALALASLCGIAYAGGLYTNGFPVAGTVPNTLPLTGNELIPADTQLPNGLSPQTEAISTSQLAAMTGNNASRAVNAATSSVTVTAAQLVGTGGYHILDMTGTLGGAGVLTTPTAAAIIAQLPNAQNTASFMVRIINETAATNAWTLTAGTNVTVTGTATIVAAGYTDWIVTLNAAAATPTVTFQRAGSGTN